MKVASNDPSFFAEKFSVYVYDENDLVTPPEIIYTETLSTGGDGSAKDISASVPVSYAGKTIGFLNGRARERVALLLSMREVCSRLMWVEDKFGGEV